MTTNRSPRGIEARGRVVICGGGPGGIEAALAVQSLAGDRLHVELVCADPRFVYRPWSTAEPFGLGSTTSVDLELLASERGFGFVRARAEAVDVEGHELVTDAGRVPYDVLVLALGARQVPSVAGGLMFRGPRDVESLRVALEQRAGDGHARVAYVANASSTWPLPAYELALMTRVWGRRRGTPVDVALVTSELEPLEAFGPATSAQVRELLADRGVELFTGTVAESFTGGRLLEVGAGSIPADLAVALPALVGPALAGVPHDLAGFVPVDGHCRVFGAEDVYAVGDMTARDLKQGGLATQQADVAAASIAASAGVVCETPRYQPVLRALLLTGEGPVYMRHPSGTGGARDEDRHMDSPWWPPHKIAGRHLGPYLATHADLLTPVTADA